MTIPRIPRLPKYNLPMSEEELAAFKLQQSLMRRADTTRPFDATVDGVPTNSSVIYDPKYGYGTPERIAQARQEGGYVQVGRPAPNVAAETEANLAYVQAQGGALAKRPVAPNPQLNQSLSPISSPVVNTPQTPFTQTQRKNLTPWKRLPNYRR